MKYKITVEIDLDEVMYGQDKGAATPAAALDRFERHAQEEVDSGRLAWEIAEALDVHPHSTGTVTASDFRRIA